MDVDLERVEVRSLEDGFLGSWQSGTVVSREPGGFLVRYDHLIDDDNVSAPLCERVDLSGLASDPPRGCRGLIRPLRDRRQFGCGACSGLRYGVCVDAFYNDAWWEGVIFDHLDGSESRRVLFPDLGDELSIPVGLLRETFDWNEAADEWERRGCWVFLMVIEGYWQQFGSLWVSVRQIWYDVRKKKCFQTFGDWTYSERRAWEELVYEVMDDNLRLNLDGLFRLMDSPEEAAGHGDMSVEGTLLEDQHHHHNGSFSPPRCSRKKSTPTPTPAPASSRLAKSECWQLAGPDMVPGPKFQPSAITEYVGRSSKSANGTKKKNLNVLKTNCRNHLAHLGWKILVATERVSRGKMRGEEFRRICYVSPGGRNYYSLPQVCQYLEGQKCQNLCTAENNILFLPLAFEKPQLIKAVHENPPLTPTNLAFAELEPEYCPQAVQDWYIYGARPKQNYQNKKEMFEKAMRHLAAVGWTLWYVYKGAKREVRCSSPAGKRFFSLRTACKWCMDKEGGVLRIDALDCKVAGSVKALELFKVPPQILGASAQASSHVESAVVSSVVGLTDQRKRKLRDTGSRKTKKQKLSPAPLLVGNNGSCAARVRQLVVRSSSKHVPRTLLSWLIDNNVVLPRAKVEYRCREDNRRMAAGRITRDGIKCSCCQNVFTLMRFEAHAGSKYHRPAANIFLEDGRSLLGCQMQIMSNDNGFSFPSESNHSTMSDQRQHESDYVCSICRFGGELILCDQCPSSFHKNCVGLKDIPDANWFCPFCCCRICRQRELNGDSDEDIDNCLLSCSQCERQYHGCCLPEKLETNHQENWFCSEICRKIFVSLHEIVGKTISLDSKFSWTLLRTNNYDRNDHGSIDIEAVAENYSKLNVAIGVMHECFEPVQEVYTGRDLVEDVIFSKGSQLKRLNFQRFYTVLLERNDEVISVAAIRVHDDKLAEIPLVATRFQYRRLGMCRILMKQLETMLTKLGIERLVLPAAENVLNTWTASFGFSKMMDCERLELLDYTFLDFVGTVMCQKLLMRVHSIESERIQRKLIKTKRPSDPLCSIDCGGEDHKKELQELALLKGEPDCNNSTECHIEYAGGTHMKKFQEPSLLECKPPHCEFSTEISIEDVGACHLEKPQDSAPLEFEPLRSEINTKSSFEVVGQEKEFQGPSPPQSLKFRIKINRESSTSTTVCNKSFCHIATHYKCYKRKMS